MHTVDAIAVAKVTEVAVATEGSSQGPATGLQPQTRRGPGAWTSRSTSFPGTTSASVLPKVPLPSLHWAETTRFHAGQRRIAQFCASRSTSHSAEGTGDTVGAVSTPSYTRPLSRTRSKCPEEIPPSHLQPQPSILPYPLPSIRPAACCQAIYRDHQPGGRCPCPRLPGTQCIRRIQWTSRKTPGAKGTQRGPPRDWAAYTPLHTSLQATPTRKSREVLHRQVRFPDRRGHGCSQSTRPQGTTLCLLRKNPTVGGSFNKLLLFRPIPCPAATLLSQGLCWQGIAARPSFCSAFPPPGPACLPTDTGGRTMPPHLQRSGQTSLHLAPSPRLSGLGDASFKALRAGASAAPRVWRAGRGECTVAQRTLLVNTLPRRQA